MNATKRKQESIIDYIIIMHQKSTMHMLDIQVYRGRDYESNHYLLSSKIHFTYIKSTCMKKYPKEMQAFDYPQYNLEGFLDKNAKNAQKEI